MSEEMSTPEHDGVIRTAMSELLLSFVVPASIEDILARVTSAAVELIDGVDFADVLLISDGEFRSLAATADAAPELDAAQQRFGEGPCVDAATSDEVMRCPDMTSDTRWPQFGPAAVEAGVRRMLSFKLYNHRTGTGALNLFGRTSGEFTAESEAIAAMLATHASVALIAANRQNQFESALVGRDIIGQAKGMLMERFGIDAVRAFELMVKLSQDSNTPVAVIASRIVERGRDSVTDARADSKN